MCFIRVVGMCVIFGHFVKEQIYRFVLLFLLLLLLFSWFYEKKKRFFFLTVQRYRLAENGMRLPMAVVKIRHFFFRPNWSRRVGIESNLLIESRRMYVTKIVFQTVYSLFLGSWFYFCLIVDELVKWACSCAKLG